MRIVLGAVLAVTALAVSTPAVAQRSSARRRPDRHHRDLRVPEMFRAPGDRRSRSHSELRTPERWRRAPREARVARRRQRTDLVVPEIFRRPSEPSQSTTVYRDLRTPERWATPRSAAPSPSPRASAPSPPPPVVNRRLDALHAEAERTGTVRVGPYVFTLAELRAAIAYLGGETDTEAFVAGAGPQLLARARSRGEAAAIATPRREESPLHLGRALDRP